jgi:hypothetical protein
MSPMSPHPCSNALPNHHKTGHFPAARLLRAFCMLPKGHGMKLVDVIESKWMKIKPLGNSPVAQR